MPVVLAVSALSVSVTQCDVCFALPCAVLLLSRVLGCHGACIICLIIDCDHVVSAEGLH